MSVTINIIKTIIKLQFVSTPLPLQNYDDIANDDPDRPPYWHDGGLHARALDLVIHVLNRYCFFMISPLYVLGIARNSNVHYLLENFNIFDKTSN